MLIYRYFKVDVGPLCSMHLLCCGCHINVHVIIILIMIDQRKQIYWKFVKCVMEIYWKFLRLDL